MPTGITPRRIPGWEFFNENVGVCDVVRPGGIEALGADDRKVAELFIGALSGRRKVVDIGCGSGFPGLYLAPHVGEIVGVDAAPNMITAARKNALELGVNNALFQVAGADGLPFENGQFDGVLLCGVLESMDWPGVRRMMAEVRRLIAPGGRIVVLDQDWRDVLERKPLNETSVRRKEGRLIVRFVQRTESPATEKDTRYLVNPESALGRRLLAALGDKASAPVIISPEDLDPNAVLDAWYDEAAQFNAESLKRLVESQGFQQSNVDVLPVWGQRVLFLTAVR
jgi:ubiquinone/menaquinone biosynthesis C-methylase UbiE